ncbi:MAG: penicillin-binding protein activator LpoB [Bacteroidales bacterium]|jgi:hypothetical protein|nr:penicillin-binding protein activator LpoB [Bacteroidales bacterium]
MKKSLALFVSLALFSQLVFSAEDRDIVGLYPFSGNKDAAATLQAKVSNELLKLNRVILVDKKNQTTQKQDSDAFTKSNTIGEYGKQLGAAYMLNGVISKVNVEDLSYEDKKGEKKASWSVELSIDLSVVDVASGKILSSATFSTTQKGKSKENCFKDIYENIIERSIPFLSNSFPIKATIVSVTQNEKGAVDEIIINAGSVDGITKRIEFDVFEKIYMNDNGQEKIMEDFVGQIKVKEVKGDDFSLCTVSSKKEAMKRILGDPKAFIVKTTKEKVR